MKTVAIDSARLKRIAEDRLIDGLGFAPPISALDASEEKLKEDIPGIAVDSILLSEILVDNYREITSMRYDIYLELSSNKLILRLISEKNYDHVKIVDMVTFPQFIRQDIEDIESGKFDRLAFAERIRDNANLVDLDGITAEYNNQHDREEWINLYWAAAPGMSEQKSSKQATSIAGTKSSNPITLSLNLSPREYVIALTNRYNELAEYASAISDYLDNVVKIMMEHNGEYLRSRYKGFAGSREFIVFAKKVSEDSGHGGFYGDGDVIYYERLYNLHVGNINRLPNIDIMLQRYDEEEIIDAINNTSSDFVVDKKRRIMHTNTRRAVIVKKG